MLKSTLLVAASVATALAAWALPVATQDSGNGDSELTAVEALPPAGDFTYTNDETGWEITPRSLDRR